MDRTTPKLCASRCEGGIAVYTMRCAVTSESQDVCVCERHSEHMPLVNGDLVTARPAERGVECELAFNHELGAK